MQDFDLERAHGFLEKLYRAAVRPNHFLNNTRIHAVRPANFLENTAGMGGVWYGEYPCVCAFVIVV